MTKEPQNPTFVLQDGQKVTWEELKQRSTRNTVWFQLPDAPNNLTFQIGPDFFDNSYVLRWLTIEEKQNPEQFLNNKCRSSHPDDFLSRILSLSTPKKQVKTMTRQDALQLITEYSDLLRKEGCQDQTLTELRERFPKSGSEAKAMRWLGFIQGALFAKNRFTLEELKEHNKNCSLTVTPEITVQFAGCTGPNSSGGPMAIAFVVLKNNQPVESSSYLMPENPDSSWHSSTYQALAYSLEHHYTPYQDGNIIFATDNALVVKQMTGQLAVRSGHYLESREDAINQLHQSFPSRTANIKFKWIPHSSNLAAVLAENLLKSQNITPWSYENDSNNSTLLDAKGIPQ